MKDLSSQWCTLRPFSIAMIPAGEFTGEHLFQMVWLTYFQRFISILAVKDALEKVSAKQKFQLSELLEPHTAVSQNLLQRNPLVSTCHLCHMLLQIKVTQSA